MVSSTPTTSSSSQNTGLYILTTSQIPLPIKYSHPRKPVLVIPSLIHRTLHNALDGDSPSILYQDSGVHGEGSKTIIIPHPDGLIKHDIPATTKQNGNGNDSTGTEHPSKPRETQVNGEIDGTGLSDSSSNYLVDFELTVKLHLVGDSSPEEQVESSSNRYLEWIKESLDILERYKGLNKKSIDTLLIGFKGIDYRGSKTVASEMFGCGTEGLEAPNTTTIDGDLEKVVLKTWNSIQNQNQNQNQNQDLISEKTKLGSLYSTLDLLKKLVNQRSDGNNGIRVNALDTPDCHHLPKEYTDYAKQNGVELWAGGGGEGSDPLPSSHLHNLLQEFYSKLSANTGGGFDNSKLDKLIDLREDGLKFDDRRQSALNVKWVLSYTLVSKTRNVVRDKGYIVAANLTA